MHRVCIPESVRINHSLGKLSTDGVRVFSPDGEGLWVSAHDVAMACTVNDNVNSNTITGGLAERDNRVYRAMGGTKGDKASLICVRLKALVDRVESKRDMDGSTVHRYKQNLVNYLTSWSHHTPYHNEDDTEGGGGGGGSGDDSSSSMSSSGEGSPPRRRRESLQPSFDGQIKFVFGLGSFLRDRSYVMIPADTPKGSSQPLWMCIERNLPTAVPQLTPTRKRQRQPTPVEDNHHHRDGDDETLSSSVSKTLRVTPAAATTLPLPPPPSPQPVVVRPLLPVVVG